ncbi:MAG: methyltransferase domain-containing protein [Spirochaetota bacterium]|nr:methyltransferase domain-containing protein [Spirochaetota bacterium]
METQDYELVLPEIDENIEQDEEWLIINYGERQERVKFHDYGAIYNIPGLYEELFYEQLHCKSPTVVCDLLNNTIEEMDNSINDLRVLDFGAGNGMVGDILKSEGCDLLVGVDILPEAKNAALRDRPNIYDNYHVMDFSNLNEVDTNVLEQYNFNTLISVAALGFGDISPIAFLNAYNLIEDDGIVVFNIKNKFLSDDDESGYKDIIDSINDEYISIHHKEEYCHRLSLDGRELYYTAIVCSKIKNVDFEEIVQ